MSEPTIKFTGKAIIGKIHQLMCQIPYLQKDETNKEQKYKYLSSEAVAEKIQPALIDLRLIALPEFETIHENEYSTKSGAIWKYVRVRLIQMIVDIESGEYCIAISEGSGTDPGDKAVAKAQTMADKILWCKLLKIPIGEDPERDPRTDQVQFVSPPSVSNLPTAPVPPSPPTLPGPVAPTYGFPAHETDIVGVWTRAGWDPANNLIGWVFTRYNRQPAELTVEECFSILKEFEAYVASKTGGQ